jgi:hypothetical protein
MLVLSSTQEHSESTGNIKESMDLVFANRNKEDSIHPLTTREIAETQECDTTLLTQAVKEGYSAQLVEDISVLCIGNKLVIPKSLHIMR